jgi:RNA polymerase sigma factor (sigma-70 family)
VNLNVLEKSARNGDRAAEADLFRRLSESFRLFTRLKIRNPQDREEVVQEALATIAQKYRKEQFETSFAAWAYRILEFKVMNYYRSVKNRDKVFAPVSDDDVQEAGRAVDPTLKARLLDCLRKLSKTRLAHARILTLHFQGFSVSEICDRVGISSNNLYVRLSRARKLLANCLENGDVR